MPQRDLYHDTVVEALKHDGWTITNDPLELAFGDRKVFTIWEHNARLALRRARKGK